MLALSYFLLGDNDFAARVPAALFSVAAVLVVLFGYCRYLACLPNHIMGKGMMKAVRKRNPYANIAAIDYDPGASNVNQLNRIKLMMATAYKNLKSRNKA